MQSSVLVIKAKPPSSHNFVLHIQSSHGSGKTNMRHHLLLTTTNTNYVMQGCNASFFFTQMKGASIVEREQIPSLAKEGLVTDTQDLHQSYVK